MANAKVWWYLTEAEMWRDVGIVEHVNPFGIFPILGRSTTSLAKGQRQLCDAIDETWSFKQS